MKTESLYDNHDKCVTLIFLAFDEKPHDLSFYFVFLSVCIIFFMLSFVSIP